MSASIQHLNASDLSDEALDRLAFALAGRLNKYMVVVKPMKPKEAIPFSGVSRSTFYRMVDKGFIQQFGDPNGDPLYFPDQIVEGIRNYKRKQH